MKYAHLEENTNKLLGWYSDEIHSEIPTPNIEVTDEVWQEALNINANCYENGEFIVKDWRTAEEIEAEKLAQANAEAKEYLQSTDWYVSRFTETGKEIPEEVKTKRDEARLRIK